MENIILTNLKFLRISLCIFLILFFNSNVAFADGGIGYKGIKLNLNGTNSWYNIHGVSWGYQGCGDYGSSFYNSGNANWNGSSLGTFSTTATLQITGFAVVGWASNGDYIAGKLEYKVWKQGDAEPGSWTVINIGNYQSPTSGATQDVCTSGNDRVVGYNNGTTDIQPGIAGTYNFKIKGFGRVQYTGGGGGSFNANDGNELTATFTISAAVPTISTTTSSITSNSTQTFRGATITITGTNLGSINSVKLGGAGGSACTNVTAVSATQVTAVVPDGTTGGTIWISNGTNSATSSDSYSNLGFISNNTGNWNTGATWIGGSVPSSGVAVTIANGHEVTLDMAATVSVLTINSGGTFNNGTAQTLTINASGTLTNSGTFTRNTGSVTFSGSGTVSGTVGFNNVNITGAVNFGIGSTINGILSINSGGSVITNAPTYANTSLLKYNTGGNPTSRGLEWSASSGAGYPNDVQVSLNTTLDIPNTVGAFSTNLSIARDLIIDAGSSLYMDYGAGAASGSLTVGRDISIAGNLSLGDAIGGDLSVGRNWTHTTGTFNANLRAVAFNGATGDQTITNTNGETFPYLTINKATSGGVILGGPITVSNTLILTKGVVATTSSNLLHITNTSAAAISGGNSTSYINGPLRWSVSNGSGGDYKFHLGKSSTYLPLNVNNPTGTSPVLTAEAFTSNSGGAAGSGLASLSTAEYWSVVNTGTLSSATISLAKSSIGSNDGIGTSTTLAGTYTNLGGSVTNTLINSNTVTAASTVGSLATTTYFVLATKVAAPTISSITSSGYVGSTITISGTNLTGATAVSIGGVAAAGFTVNSAASISATVAAGGATGTISVTTPGGTATSSSSFTFNGYVSTQNGDWNTAGTWLGGSVPPASATVTIDHAVTVDGSVTNAPSSVTINSAKSLTFGASGTLTATTVTNVGSIVMTAGGTLTIATGGMMANGTSTFTGGSGTVAFAGTGAVTGTIGFNNVTLAGGVNFGTLSTIHGILSINSNGFVNTNPPTYASGSTLRYNSGGSYGRGTEWSATSGAGYPHHVQISNSTTISLGANSGTGTARQLAGNLTVDASSTLTMNATSEVMTQELTVKGNYINNGTTILSGTSGGDLALEGNLTDNATFTANGRAIFFRGGNTQSITSNTNPLDIDVMRVEKSGGEIVLLQNLLVDETGDPIQFSGTSSILNLNGYTATFGKASTASTITMNSTSAIKGSSTSSLTILGTGAAGTIRFDQTTDGSTNALQNLTINRTSAGSVTLGNSLTVGGTLTLTDGSLVVGANTLTYSGSSITRTNGTIDASNASATLAFTNTSALTLPASLFSGNVNNLTMNGAGGVTLGSATTIAGVLTLTSGSLVVGANTLTINGSLNRTSGSIDATNNLASVVFTGSGDTEVPISALGSNLTNLTVNKSGTVQLGGDVTVNGILTMTLGDLEIGTGNLTLGSSASVSNAGASSHILATSTGELRKIYSGNGSFTFPVGDGTNYTPATLNFTAGSSITGASDDYVGVRLKTSKVTGMNNGNQHYINRSWFIEPGAGLTGYTYTVNLNYVNADVVGTESNIKPVKKSSGVWHYPGDASFEDGTQLSGTVSNLSDPASNVLVWSGLTSFSEFGGGGQGGPLPVELTSFSASCEEDIVTLSWSTASEQNSSHFDVEKSTDGENWRVIGTVLAAGNSTQDINYSFTDDEKSNGQNYYRLNQVDIDGKNEYYGPLHAACENDQDLFMSFPNPSDKNGFSVVLNSKTMKGIGLLTISDLKGNVVYTKHIEVQDGISLWHVSDTDLETGVYFIQVVTENKISKVIRHALN